MSHTHTHTIDVIVDVRMTSCDVIVGIRMTSLPVYGHTECDTRLFHITWLCPALGSLRLETFGPTKVLEVEEAQAVEGARFNYDLPAKQLVHFLKGLRKYMSLLPSLEVEV